MDWSSLHVFVGTTDAEHVIRSGVRMLCAIAFGGAIGWERMGEGKVAGIRTHALVALGAAMFIIVPGESRLSPADLSRVIQGVATGIGFLGAGTILKLSEQHTIEGLTSAASIWITAGIGLAAGMGLIWPSVLGLVLSLTILRGGHVLENWVGGNRRR